MDCTAADLDFYKWTFPGAPVRIHIDFDVLDTITAESLSRFSSPAQDVGGCGLLVGTRVGADIYIAGRVCCSSLKALAVEASVTEAARVLGFYRVVSMSEWDLNHDELSLIETHFTAPSDVFMHVRPDTSGSLVGGFFFRDGRSVVEHCFMEFPCDTARLRQETQLGFPNISAEIAGRSSVEEPAPSAVSIPPPENSRPGGRLSAIISTALITLIVSVAAATVFVLFRFRQNPQPSAFSGSPSILHPIRSNEPGVGLALSKEGNAVHIRWQKTDAILQSTCADLRITDGTRPERVLKLNAREVQTGSVVYTPSRDPVSVTFEISPQCGSAVSESVVSLAADEAPRSRAPAATMSSADTLVKPFIPSMPRISASALTTSIPDVPPAISQPVSLPVSSSDTVLNDAVNGLALQVPEAEPANTRVLRPISSSRQSLTPALVRPAEAVRRVYPSLGGGPRLTTYAPVTVEVSVHIGVNGRVTEANVTGANAGISVLLQNAALEAARKWTFRPASVRNQPIASTMRIRFNFNPPSN